MELGLGLGSRERDGGDSPNLPHEVRLRIAHSTWLGLGLGLEVGLGLVLGLTLGLGLG